MARSRRELDAGDAPPDVWAVVDSWAEREVEPVRLRARWSGRAVPARGIDHFVDVTGDAARASRVLRAAGVRARPIRPDRRALGATGEVAYPASEDLVTALRAAGIDHRVVQQARRYQWSGPLTGPTFCEISTEPDGRLTVESWYQPVWTDTFRLRSTPDREARRRPGRVQQARAAINRLLEDLGGEPITTDQA